MTPMTDEQLAAHRALAKYGEVSDRDGAVMLQLLDYIDVLRNRAVAVAALEDIRQLIGAALGQEYGSAPAAVKDLLERHQKFAGSALPGRVRELLTEVKRLEVQAGAAKEDHEAEVSQLRAEIERLKAAQPVAATDFGVVVRPSTPDIGSRVQETVGQLALHVLSHGSLAAVVPILKERHRQHAKWGEQNHPVKTRGTKAPSYGMYSSDKAREICEGAVKIGTITWGHILVEEVAEFLDADTPEDQAREIEQVGALAVQIREYLERVKKGGGP